jgi:Ca2+-binding RTX toxin-like protein
MRLNRRIQGALAVTAVGVGGLVLAVSGGAAPGDGAQSCKGIPETTSGLTGTNHHDVIVGTNGDDFIDAGGGNDLVCGKRGDDSILGGTGNDLILANAGNDGVDAGEGDDKAKGNAGPDGCIIEKGKGKGNPCFDKKRGVTRGIYGGPGNDIVGGGTGDDVVSGEEDDDANRCAAGFDFSPDDEGVNSYQACEISPQQTK